MHDGTNDVNVFVFALFFFIFMFAAKKTFPCTDITPRDIVFHDDTHEIIQIDIIYAANVPESIHVCMTGQPCQECCSL